MSHQKIYKIFTIGLVLSLILFRLHLAGIASAQSPAPANNVVSVIPATQSKIVGDTGSVSINITNGQGIASYQLDLNYDKTIFRVDSVVQGAYLTSTGRTLFPVGPNINNSSGVTSFGAGTGGTQSAPTGDGTLATVNFTVIGSGTSQLAINNLMLTDKNVNILSGSTVNGQVVVSAAASPVATPSPIPTPTPVSTPQASPVAGTAQLTLNLVDAHAFAGADFNVDLNLSVSTPVIGVDAIILFDPSKLNAVSVTDKHLLPVTPKIDVNNGNGTIKLSQVVNVGSPYTGQGGTIATITFKSASTGQRNIGFDFVQGAQTESNVFDTNGNDILQAPKDLVFDVVDHSTLQMTLTTPSKNGYAVSGNVSDANSNWSAPVNTDTTGTSNKVALDDGFIGTIKTFLFKVSGFLRRRFNINILSGNNLFGLGLLKAGDINDDGIINNADLSLMYDQWFGTGTSDLNKDGVVNTADYFVISQNFMASDE